MLQADNLAEPLFFIQQNYKKHINRKEGNLPNVFLVNFFQILFLQFLSNFLNYFDINNNRIETNFLQCNDDICCIDDISRHGVPSMREGYFYIKIYN